jgi:hypothetical protein
MGPKLNADIQREDRPAAVAIKFGHPIDIRRVGGEFFAKGDKLMGREQMLQ